MKTKQGRSTGSIRSHKVARDIPTTIIVTGLVLIIHYVQTLC